MDAHPSLLMQKAASLRSDREKILEVIRDLKQQELKRFRFFLKDVESSACRADGGAAPPRITAAQLENAEPEDLVDLMLQTFCLQAVEKTKEILRKIPGMTCWGRCLEAAHDPNRNHFQTNSGRTSETFHTNNSIHIFYSHFFQCKLSNKLLMHF